MINYFQAIQTAFNEKNAYQMFRRNLIAFFYISKGHVTKIYESQAKFTVEMWSQIFSIWARYGILISQRSWTN